MDKLNSINSIFRSIANNYNLELISLDSSFISEEQFINYEIHFPEGELFRFSLIFVPNFDGEYQNIRIQNQLLFEVSGKSPQQLQWIVNVINNFLTDFNANLPKIDFAFRLSL